MALVGNVRAEAKEGQLKGGMRKRLRLNKEVKLGRICIILKI